MKLCPICTLVSGTWLSLLVYRAVGYDVDPALIAALMGGSAVGIAYLIERHLPHGRSATWFKLLFIPFLLLVAYSVASERWLFALVALVVSVSVIVIFFRRSGPVKKEIIQEAEKKLEQCC